VSVEVAALSLFCVSMQYRAVFKLVLTVVGRARCAVKFNMRTVTMHDACCYQEAYCVSVVVACSCNCMLLVC
jgi:hypothetical protein